MSDCSQESNCPNQSCETTTYQMATVNVPITVTPTANTGDINTVCCGSPTITPCSCKCTYTGDETGSCSYIISQNICIEVPIEFSATACVGDPCVECGRAINKDMCK